MPLYDTTSLQERPRHLDVLVRGRRLGVVRVVERDRDVDLALDEKEELGATRIVAVTYLLSRYRSFRSKATILTRHTSSSQRYLERPHGGDS